MPQLNLVKPVVRRKLDVTPFFKSVMDEGEEAYITMQRISKYQFSYLINKGKEGYINFMYASLKDVVDATGTIPEKDWNDFREAMTDDELNRRMRIEFETSQEYCKLGIALDGHNFLDDNNKPIELDGEWFYLTYGELMAEVNGKNMALSTYLIQNITLFNYEGLTLGEPISRS